MTKPFLLVGGDADPQMIRLLKQATTHGIPLRCLLTGKSGTPKLTWDIHTGCLVEGDNEITAHAAFIRQDVFAFLVSNSQHDQASAGAWYTTVLGWLRGHPEVRIYNREFLARGGVNKPYVLQLAKELGLAVAETYISNDISLVNRLVATGQWINKPVCGGSYCETLEAYDSEYEQGSLAYPFIVQSRLEPPELRVFRVGAQWFGFNVISDALDYRTSSSTRIKEATIPDGLVDTLTQLSDHLGLDFAAADFKTCPESQDLQFLEINSNPMFAGFDQVVDGALVDAIMVHLDVLS